MTRTLYLLATTAALALAGCSKQPDPTPAQTAATETETVVEETSEPADVPTAADTETPVAMDALPDAVRGRWGLVRADCTSTNGDAKGLLEVSADQLKFYESVAKLGEIKEAGERRVRATFAYTGEGQSWTQDVVLDAQEDGKTLVRREYGKDAMPGPLTYTRCT